jgi:hypothetical protein
VVGLRSIFSELTICSIITALQANFGLIDASHEGWKRLREDVSSEYSQLFVML